MSVLLKLATVPSGPGLVTSMKVTCTPSAWSSKRKKLIRPPLPSSGLTVAFRPDCSPADVVPIRKVASKCASPFSPAELTSPGEKV